MIVFIHEDTVKSCYPYSASSGVSVYPYACMHSECAMATPPRRTKFCGSSTQDHRQRDRARRLLVVCIFILHHNMHKIQQAPYTQTHTAVSSLLTLRYYRYDGDIALNSSLVQSRSSRLQHSSTHHRNVSRHNCNSRKPHGRSRALRKVR